MSDNKEVRDPQAEAYSRWYNKNKEALSEKRKKRYREDPAYRAACLERKARQSKSNKVAPVPEDYVKNLTETSEWLGVSLWVLRSWREKGYIPEPYTHATGVYFTEWQLSYLQKLRDFFATATRPLSLEDQGTLQGISDLAHANW